MGLGGGHESLKFKTSMLFLTSSVNIVQFRNFRRFRSFHVNFSSMNSFFSAGPYPWDINKLFSSVEVGKCLGLYTEQKLEATLSLLLGYLRYNVFNSLLRIRIRKILASWIRIRKNMRIHGLSKGQNINQKLQKKCFTLKTPI